MTIRELFYNAGGVLRAPWRLAGFVLITVAVMALALVILGAFRIRSMEMLIFGQAVAALVSLTVAHLFMVRVVDDLSWRAVWMDKEALRPRTLGWAVVVGGAAVAIPALALLTLGWLDALGAPGTVGDAVRYGLLMLLVLLPAAAYEELLFRGYPMRVLQDALGAWPAVLITAVLFGVAHAGNLGTIDPLALAVVTLAGAFLGWIVLVTGSLYAGIAAHLAWNAVLVVALHTEVSGAQLGTAPVYRVVDAGPDWATGGTWGPEGGLAAAVGLGAALMLTLARRGSREER